MDKIRRILVAIKDANARSLPAVNKAAQLAHAFGAQLELFHGITERLSADAVLWQQDSLLDAERALRTRYRDKLESIARRLREEGLEVKVTADWDFPVYEAIVRRARRAKADLIVAECHAGRRLAPWLLHITDWELLRTSPVPVLLVKNGKPYQSPVVLAALDPAHAFAKPAKLDDVILRAASHFTRALQGSLHAMHAFNAVPSPMGPMNGAGAAVAMEAIAELQEQARKDFARAVGRKVPRTRQHLVPDVAIDAIPATARDTDAALVVMGAISRSGFKRLLIGNTAEQVLNRLTADVLVVKPAKFATRVRSQVRGTRIISTAGLSSPY
jgi:universal stress protein E